MIAIDRAVVVALVAAALTGCGVEARARPLAPTISTWRHGLDRLAMLRRKASVARTDRVALEVFEPRTKRRFTARGALAIAPPHSLRMILLGPGGTTAFDLWIGGDRYRFVVHAIERTARGDLRGPASERRGMPVDFLRSWLLRGAAGDLLWYTRDHDADRFVLRDGTAIVHLVAHDDGRIELRRATWVHGERVDVDTIAADRLGCATVKYHQGSSGLEMTVRCEGETLGDPPPRAIADPDAEDAP